MAEITALALAPRVVFRIHEELNKCLLSSLFKSQRDPDLKKKRGQDSKEKIV